MSPHIFDYRERFSLAGQPASSHEVIKAWETVVRPYCIEMALRHPGQQHSFHEVNILMALVLFEWHQLNWAVIEVGIGGRYDQTTALSVAATVLTNVGQDHEPLLGQELWQRALDKAGIARPDTPLFTAEQNPDVLAVIEGACRHVNAPFQALQSSHFSEFSRLLQRLKERPLAASALLNLAHQQQNAALALAVLTRLFPQIEPQQFVERFLSVDLLGRFLEVEPGVYADVAHNPEKMETLAGSLKDQFDKQEKIFVVGVSGKRSAQAIFAPIMPLAKAIIVTSASFRGQEPEAVKEALERLDSSVPLLVIAEPQQAVQAAKSMRGQDDLVILTGSAYMIDQALNPDPYLRYLNATQGWREPQRP